jgi:hypothetical protein
MRGRYPYVMAASFYIITSQAQITGTWGSLFKELNCYKPDNLSNYLIVGFNCNYV